MKCLKCGKRITNTKCKCGLDLESNAFVLIRSFGDKTVKTVEKFIKSKESTNKESGLNQIINHHSDKISSEVSPKEIIKAKGDSERIAVYSDAKISQKESSKTSGHQWDISEIVGLVFIIILIALACVCLVGPSVITGLLVAGEFDDSFAERLESSFVIFNAISNLPALVQLPIWSLIICFSALSGQFVLGPICRAATDFEGKFFPIAGQVLTIINVAGFIISYFVKQGKFGFGQLLLMLVIFGWPLVVCWITYDKIYG